VSDIYVFFLVVLFVIAVIVRDDFVFIVFYLIAIAYIFGRISSKRAFNSIKFARKFNSRAFLGETIPVSLEVTNTTWLPVVWLRIHESIPINLLSPNFFNQVISLGPYGHASYEYKLFARRRGYYKLGPISASSGDLLGMAGEYHSEGNLDYLTVYPMIVPFAKLTLPSRSPMGTLRHTQPIFEDPTRVTGKRDYIAGDSLRRIDWKTSAATGRLQVKQYEPSIALETSIFLNLNASEYEQHHRIDSVELAIVIAASIANWVTGQKQTVGFSTNGSDPIAEDQRVKTLPPRKGRGHLMRILDILARVQSVETIPLVELLRQESVHLSWGTTLIIIAGLADEALFDQLFQVLRRGLDIMLILAGPVYNLKLIQQRADYFGFPVYSFLSERDLYMWR
jgi:uncharacterized protein (DUF58 family)